MLKKAFIFLLAILLISPCFPVPSADAAGRPGITARGAILVAADSGEVLYEQNPDLRLPMASTTKIMTALLALEEAREENRVVRVTETMVAVEGTSMGLLPDDRITLVDLAAGMLLASGNDAANTAAISIAGSVEAFSEEMNRKARELGMKNSHFVTPSGLDAEAHYSTARDMATLTREALRDYRFAEICGMKSRKIRMESNRTLSVYNHNKLLRMYEGCIGVKTGFTKKSGRCLASAAERNGVTLIAVTLNAADDWNAHMSLFDYGFSRMMRHNGTAEMANLYRVPLVGGTAEEIRVFPTKFGGTLLKKGSAADFTYEVQLPRFVYAPLEEGRVVGEVVCKLNGNEVGRLDLLSAEDYAYKEEENAGEKKPGFFARLFGWGREEKQ